MRYALTSTQMRAAENRAVAEGLTTVAELMQRAGTALADVVAARCPQGMVAVVCGPGNNGGDGWVAARVLHERKRPVLVAALRSPDDLQGEAADAAAAALRSGVTWFQGRDVPFHEASVVVDAIFGFGFHGPPTEPYATVIRRINEGGALVISADMPSGVDADTGAVEGPAVRADITLSFNAHKAGLLMYPGAQHAGELLLADLGLPGAFLEVDDAVQLPEPADLLALFPLPNPGDHKGSRGRVALVAGSLTYPGAAVLAAEGAARMGAGFTVAVAPEPVADVLRVSLPNILVRAVPADDRGAIVDADAVLAAIADADAVVVGPGLTSAGAIPGLVRRLIAEVSVPLLCDADGLNAVADDDEPFAARRAPLVITPHPGEAARLLRSTNAEVQDDRLAAAAALCTQGRVCLLKGARTIVSGHDRRALILAGNAGLARAGSGDVLSGMLGTLLAQHVDPFDAAVLAAFLHGRAAEHGTSELTETCFTSTDIVRFLPNAVRDILGE